MSRILLAIGAVVLFIGSLAIDSPAHAERVLTGTTASGAYYRIAVPDTWKMVTA